MLKRIQIGLPVLALISAAALPAQSGSSIYALNKNQVYLQTSASSVALDPLSPAIFLAQSGANATLTMPGGATAGFVFDAEKSRYQVRQIFSSKAAMDAAFPIGAYRISGAGAPTVSLNLGADNYPATTPQLVSASSGSWNSGGVLVIDPTQSVTLNFSTFTGYATSGVAGHINFFLHGTMDPQNQNVRLESERFSQPLFGNVAQPTPLTSYTIPAGTFVSGRVYRVFLDFDTIVSMDTSIVPGGVVGTLFTKELIFYVAAQNPGTTTLPPVLVTPPTNMVATIGGSVTFSCAVTVGGVRTNFQNSGITTPISFEWRHNGEELGDLSASRGKYSTIAGDNLTINSLTAADAGEYAVRIVTAGGIVTTVPVTLTFAGPVAPTITAQPRGATANAGTTVAFTAAATGTPTPTFQWRKDGAAINGATSDTLVLANIASSAAGSYTVVVSNSAGFVTSNSATLVVTSGQPSRLPNLSVRTNLGAAQTLIVGFSTNGAKTMLIRGVGPTLAAFGLSGVLPDPVVELYNSAAAKIDENNDWSSSLSSVFNDVGAFALTNGSKDAALQRVCTGSYTAQIKSVGSGVVLVEVYDSGGSGKLMNVSARNAVGTGDNILIAGFVVDGTAAKTLLIRGVGAKLAEFGVGGVLADPKLEIYNSGGLKIAENDSWNSLLQPLARSVGAFDLTLGSRDAALLITLAPGSYTAQISGIGGTTGEAIVEVYEVP